MTHHEPPDRPDKDEAEDPDLSFIDKLRNPEDGPDPRDPDGRDPAPDPERKDGVLPDDQLDKPRHEAEPHPES